MKPSQKIHIYMYVCVRQIITLTIILTYTQNILHVFQSIVFFFTCKLLHNLFRWQTAFQTLFFHRIHRRLTASKDGSHPTFQHFFLFIFCFHSPPTPFCYTHVYVKRSQRRFFFLSFLTLYSVSTSLLFLVFHFHICFCADSSEGNPPPLTLTDTSHVHSEPSFCPPNVFLSNIFMTT